MPDARRAAEHAARHAYGRLLSLLVARSRDIAASEDALADAFVAALRSWPESGVPANPDAWLLTAARHALSNARRHQGVVDASAVDLALLADELAPEAAEFPDERLKLLFVCAHPAIDARVRTPLMLQTVLGLDAAQIAAAFLLPAATIGQRLVRAKAKIRDARLRFELPTQQDMPGRLGEVLDAIYAAYGTSWDAVPGAAPDVDGRAPDLADEAIFLCRLLVALLPAEPEARGLLALMLYCASRRAARSGPDGRFIALQDQDARLWSRDLIVEAEGLLTSASRAGIFGRYQCEAAIQSVHAQRPITGHTNHPALLTLYALLAERCPSVGAWVGQAAALTQAGHAAPALAVLQRIAVEDVRAYQPYWVTLARALSAAGQAEAAEAALQTAIGLTQHAAVRAFLAGTVE
jgi:RNA polymerase sigma-70 factor (ECF subfamily)